MEKEQIKKKFKDTTSVPDYIRYDGISWASTKSNCSNYKLAKDANLRLNDLLSCFENKQIFKLSEEKIEL